jgi:hypothetical protein
MNTLLMPKVLAQSAFRPIATLPVPEVLERRALQPRAALVALVQPMTIPAPVGVAGNAAGMEHHLTLLPVETKT